ncbi:ester cyclase [Streptomyces griseorubiginosus]|uniref:ester cyclase n=1 Tax=Streptomyces griseorubiginosus TaxID=67304 RepID=UPI001AD74073|nr:ester cyclase [Streptomyces griseorubiginosus]MBO4252455.1 hypothetical protein [Streptomyces griseorubiginosus]
MAVGRWNNEEKRNAAVARRWLTEGAMGQVGLAEKTFTADFRTNGRLVGTAGPQRNVANRLNGFPDLEVTIEEQLADDDKVVTRLTWRGTHTGEYSGLPPTGRRVAVQALTVFHFRDGKVFQNWTVIDHFELFRQLGALPPRLLPAQVPATEQ